MYAKTVVLTLLTLIAGLAQAQSLTQEGLLTIAPNSTECVKSEPELPSDAECRTADIVAPLIEHSFTTYNITDPVHKALITAHMAYQSQEFKYKFNLLRHGHGTANQQGPYFNVLYGQSLPNISEAVTGLGISTEAWDSYMASSDETLDQLVALVSSDDANNFGSGAWFFSTQCDANVTEALATDPIAGFTSFITVCSGAEITIGLLAYFDRAMTVFTGQGIGQKIGETGVTNYGEVVGLQAAEEAINEPTDTAGTDMAIEEGIQKISETGVTNDGEVDGVEAAEEAINEPTDATGTDMAIDENNPEVLFGDAGAPPSPAEIPVEDNPFQNDAALSEIDLSATDPTTVENVVAASSSIDEAVDQESSLVDLLKTLTGA